MNWPVTLSVGLLLLVVVPLSAIFTRRIQRSRATARCRRAFESSDRRYRQAYARTYANQYTPPEEETLIWSASSKQN